MAIILGVVGLFVAVGVIFGLLFGVGAWLISVCWKLGLIILVVWAIITLIKHFCGGDKK